MRKSLTILALFLLLAGTGFGAVTGVKTIGVDYPTLAAAIADLNAQGVGIGGVTINVPANYTETFTVANAGYITTTTSSATNPILIQKSGTGSNPVITAATGIGTTDAILEVAGSDYVTFDGINVSENVANTTAATQMEWGFAILKASITDGSQFITIKNCTVTLNKLYTASAGIYSNNHLSSDVTQLMITSATGSNSNLKIFNNTVTAYSGIYLTGYNDPNAPYALYDQNNEIGKDGANTILNVAGQASAGYGIFAQGQNSLKVANNSVTSTMGATGAVYGIYLTNAKNASYDLYNNYVSMQFTGGATTVFNAIYCDMGASGTTNTMNIYNNTVTGCSFSTVTTANTYYMYLASLGVNVYVYGNTVSNNTTGSTSVTATGRINYLYVGKASTTLGPIEVHDNIVTGNTRIQSTPGSGLTYGIALNGNASQVKYYNNSFTNNVIASNGGGYLLYTYGDGTKLIYNNTLNNITKAEGTEYGLYNYCSLTSGNSYIYQNKIQNMEALGATGAIYGISNNSNGNNAYIYNNMIGDFRAPAGNSTVSMYGIYSGAGLMAGVYNNTIYLNASSTGTNFTTIGVYSSTSVPMDLRNNIIVNTSVANGTGKTIGVRFSSASLATFASTSNYNNIFVPAGTRNYYYWDGTNGDQTLTAYQARMYPREAQSVTELSSFVNTSIGSCDLHLNAATPTQCEAGGSVVSTPIAITSDFDNDPRYPNSGYPVNMGFSPNAPDIGADEFGGLANDITGPAILYTPLSNTNLTGPRSLTITLTDGSGVPVSGIGLPVLYWRINAGSYQSVTATYVSPNTYSFTFGAGANILDQVYYYIVAQDLATTPNVSVSPATGALGLTANPPACTTPPTSPNSYTILESISGIKHIGVGKDYPTLSAAAAAINPRWIAGPLTLVLDDVTYPTETYPITFYSNPGSSATNVLTIKPNTGVSPVLEANVSSGIFNLSGIDYITIDGSNNGTTSRDLRIQNDAATSGTYAISLQNYNGDPATSVTLKNCILSCKPVNSSIVSITVIKATTDGGYSNIVIDNNHIRAGFVGIQNYGISGKLNTNWQITNNLIGSPVDSLSISDIGIQMQYADNTLIYNNEIMGPANGSLNVGQTGIYMGAFSTNTKVRSNKIHDFYHNSDDGWGATGLWYAAEASSVTEISDNVIYNIKAPGINPGVGQNITYGMFFRSGGNVKILFNSINLTGQYLSTLYDASSACLGFYYQATGGNFEVRNNILRNGMTKITGPSPTGKAYGIMVSLNPASMFSVIDNNDYYVDGEQGNIAQWYTNGTGIIVEYPTLLTWQTATGQEANSLTVNPQFTSDVNLLPTTTAMPHAGSYMTLVPTDITAMNRTNPPDIGAYEFTASPLITTVAASLVTNTTAQLNGTANAAGTTFNLNFDYGLTTAYGTSTAATPSVTTGTSLTNMMTSLSSLTPLTTYHFRARGVTSGGLIVYGNDMTFTTLPNAPAVVTTAATGITPYAGTLNGTVNANGGNSAVTFDWGLTSSYGNTVTATPGSVGGTTVIPVSYNLTGLQPYTTYHFRVVAVNTGGTSYGQDMTFTTQAIPPAVVTNLATNISSNSAQLNGTVTAFFAPTTVTFEYGLTTAYGSSINGTPGTVTGNTPTAVLANLGSLAINTTYHFRCVGQNAGGTIYGADQVFTTNCVAPTVTISGPANACVGSTGNTYTTQSGNSNYQWTVSAGGTITGGTGTNTITVTWNTVGPQTVTCNYQNSFGCSAPSPTTYNVTVNALPTPTITGPVTVCQYSTANTYTTQAGMTGYTWTVSAGGSITGGSGTNSIQVTWNGTGAQTVSVNYANANGCSAATPTVFNVTVNPVPAPTITGSSDLCLNSGNYAYTTEAGMTGYSWIVSAGGTIVSGQTTNQIMVQWNAAGAQTVSVNYSTASGCQALVPTVLNVTVNPIPGAAGTITGTSTVCGGTQGVGYSVSPIANAITYVWTLPAGATIASGAGTNSITVDFASNASSGDITVYGNNLCGNGTPSPAFPVTVNALPDAAGPITGPISECQGTSGVVYSIEPVANATSYTWTVPSGVTIVSGSSSNSITVDFTNTALSGDVTVYASNSCGTGTPSSLAVTVYSVPETPVITLEGSVLSSSVANGNQWYKDGVQIPGATGQTYDAVLSGSGWYWDMTTNGTCSSDTSNHIYVLVTGINEKPSAGCNIYPVPNDGHFTIVLNSESARTFSIEVISELGVSVYRKANVSVDRTLTMEVDLRPVPTGMYTVILSSADRQIIRKILINK